MSELQPSALRRALGHAGFRRLFAAQTISRWGDTFNAVALVILVYQLTGSGLKVAGAVAFEIAPVILLGFLAGAVVDRYSRRRVMIVADLGRAVVALALVFVHDRLGFIYLAAFLLSALSVFFNPAAASVLPTLVDEDEIVGANSAVWSAAVISQIALAPVAGGVVALAGPSPAFAINAVTFLASAAFLVGLPITSRTAQVAGTHLRDVVEGLRVIASSRFLKVLAAVQALAALSAGATSALLVVLAQDHLDVGPTRFGLLIAAIGVGAGFGPLVLQFLVDDVRRPQFLYGPYLLRGTVDGVLAGTSHFGVALGALAVYGVGTSTGNVTYTSVLQTTIADRVRGRVFAFYDVVWQSARLVSIGVGVVLADRFGVVSVYWAGAALLVAAGGLGLIAGRATDVAGPGNVTS